MRPTPRTSGVLAGPVPLTWLAPRSTPAVRGCVTIWVGGAPLIETATASPPEIVAGRSARYVSDVDGPGPAWGTVPLSWPEGPVTTTETTGAGRLTATPDCRPDGGDGSRNA